VKNGESKHGRWLIAWRRQQARRSTAKWRQLSNMASENFGSQRRNWRPVAIPWPQLAAMALSGWRRSRSYLGSRSPQWRNWRNVGGVAAFIAGGLSPAKAVM